MPKQESDFGKYFALPNPGLRSYLGIVEEGQPLEYRTPFYRDREVSTILKDWIRQLQPIRKDWPTLYDFEIGLSEKVGPMSVMLPVSERMPDIDAYYEGILLPSEPVSENAITSALKEWGQVTGLDIRSEVRTVELMKKSTNSGAPYFTKRRSVIKKTVPVKIDGTTQHLGPTGESWEICAVLGWRGQEGGPDTSDVKQRVVWMFPFGVNIAELRVYQPLIESFQRFNLVPAWVSMEAVDRHITKMFDTKDKHDYVIGTDFTKFDQHFNSSCQNVARHMIRELFSGSSSIAEWLVDIFPIKYNIPLAYQWDRIKFGPHGMGSGSGGTNVDETLLHRALQHEVALANGQTLNPFSQCLGDDGVLTYPGCTAEQVMQAYSSHGLEMNLDKQYVSKHDCTYLRRWHHVDYREDGICVGVYSTCRALGRLCEQERYYDPREWGPKMVALRQLSIIENVKYHPLREQFANYCMKGDKFRLGLDIPGFIDDIDTIASKATEHLPDFLGYTKSLQSEDSSLGLSNWWIVKYLKSLR